MEKNFKKDLDLSRAAVTKVADWFKSYGFDAIENESEGADLTVSKLGVTFNVEVKHDVKHKKTGNLFLETKTVIDNVRDLPGGTTKAIKDDCSFIAYVLHNNVYIYPTETFVKWESLSNKEVKVSDDLNSARIETYGKLFYFPTQSKYFSNSDVSLTPNECLFYLTGNQEVFCD